MTIERWLRREARKRRAYRTDETNKQKNRLKVAGSECRLPRLMGNSVKPVGPYTSVRRVKAMSRNCIVKGGAERNSEDERDLVSDDMRVLLEGDSVDRERTYEELRQALMYGEAVVGFGVSPSGVTRELQDIKPSVLLIQKIRDQDQCMAGTSDFCIKKRALEEARLVTGGRRDRADRGCGACSC